MTTRVGNKCVEDIALVSGSRYTLTVDEITDRIRTTAKRLGVTRSHAKEIEGILRKHINRLAEIKGRGSMSELAEASGVSDQHMSDIRYGRRGVGDKVVERLGNLR